MFQRKWFLMDSAGGDGGAGAGGAGAGAGGGDGGAGAGGGTGGAGGTGGTPAAFDWNTAVADESVRGWVTAKGFKDPAALAQTALNQEKLLGVPADQVIKLPKEMTPETMRPIYERLGVPKTPEEYGLPVPEGDKGEFAKVASGWMHKHGVPAPLARAIATEWNAFQAAQVKQHTEQMQARDAEQVTQLKADWGPQYDANSKLVDAAAKAFGMNAEQLMALKGVLGPAGAMKMLHTIGSKLGVEGDFVGGEGGGAGGPNTPEAAKAQIAALKADKAFVARYNSADPVTRQAARDEIKKLHKIAYPGDTVL